MKKLLVHVPDEALEAAKVYLKLQGIKPSERNLSTELTAWATCGLVTMSGAIRANTARASSKATTNKDLEAPLQALP